MGKVVRPTVRFPEAQYKLIQARLDERGITFQRYCLELICKDLDVPVKVFEADPDQIDLFADVNLVEPSESPLFTK